MQIRSYRGSDLAALAELFTDAVHRGAAEHYDAAQRAAWAPIPADLKQWQHRFGSVHTLVAEGADGALGFISYELDGHIDMLFTASAQNRRGIASALYAEAERVLSAREIRELFTEASRVARPFFEKQGFIVEQEEHVIRRGVVLPRYRMRKRLS